MRTVNQSSLGAPSVLTPVELDDPQPRPTEALVEVRATSVNPVDLAVRSGAFPLLDLPFVLGWDVSGVVRSVVPSTSGTFRPGDEVFGMPLFPRAAGANAELMTAPMSHLAPKPASLTHVEAAALPLVGITAWQCLVDLAGVAPGDRVLIHGAGGGVGHVATQIAAALGADVLVTASAGKHDWLRSLGATTTVDYATQDFAAEVREADVVLDTVGGGIGARSLDVLRPGGVLVAIVDQFDEGLQQQAADRSRRMVGHIVEPDGQALRKLTSLVDAGALRPHVGAIFPLEELAAAHELVSGGGLTGKVVVTVGG